MASFTRNVNYLAKWIRKPPVRSGKLSNVGPTDHNFCSSGIEPMSPTCQIGRAASLSTSQVAEIFHKASHGKQQVTLFYHF
uniref:Uncharacterized protein n=1 Tax=Acrobeloides nanus TaxID=290746 RepID=A0A914CVN9_9BILA